MIFEEIQLKAHVQLDPLAYVKAGKYRMGSNDPENAKTGEFPSKNVEVRTFKIDRYTVTNGDFL